MRSLHYIIDCLSRLACTCTGQRHATYGKQTSHSIRPLHDLTLRVTLHSHLHRHLHPNPLLPHPRRTLHLRARPQTQPPTHHLWTVCPRAPPRLLRDPPRAHRYGHHTALVSGLVVGGEWDVGECAGESGWGVLGRVRGHGVRSVVVEGAEGG